MIAVLRVGGLYAVAVVLLREFNLFHPWGRVVLALGVFAVLRVSAEEYRKGKGRES